MATATATVRPEGAERCKRAWLKALEHDRDTLPHHDTDHAIYQAERKAWHRYYRSLKNTPRGRRPSPLV